MILGFKQKINEKPTYFVEKIWEGIFRHELIDKVDDVYHEYLDKHVAKFGTMWDWIPDEMPRMEYPKIHTLRHDPTGRWKEGVPIHFSINVRTKNYFRFAPIIQCTGVQDVLLEYAFPYVLVSVNDRRLTDEEAEVFAQQDGFDSLSDFHNYFEPQLSVGTLSLKLIHWTEFRY